MVQLHKRALPVRIGWMWAVFSVVTAGCATPHFGRLDDTPWTRDQLPKSKANVVVLDEHREVHLRLHNGRPVADVVDVRRTWARNQAGADDIGLVAPYDGTFDDNIDYAVRVTSKSGDERVVSRGDMPDLAYNGSVISDARYLVAPVKVQPGDVVEEVVRKTSRKADVFAQSLVFGNSSAEVLRTSFKVCTPKGWTIKVLAMQHNAPMEWTPSTSSETSSTGPVVCQTFARNDMKPLRSERGGPGWHFRLPRVSAMLTTWVDKRGKAHTIDPTPERMSASMAKLYRDPNDEYGDVTVLTRQLKYRARKVVSAAGAKTQRDKAAVLYAYVQQSVEYCAIELGMGGWKPYAAKDVQEKGYGDCKDKANYLAALLRAEGIRSSSAGIYSHDGMPRRFGLPAVAANFNHAILVVHLDEGDVFIDPTTRSVPFGQLPINDEGADVLPFSTPGSPLQQTKVQGPDVHRSKTEAWWKVQPNTKGHFVVELDGHFASRARTSLLYSPKASWHQVATRMLSGVSRDCDEHAEVAVENADPTPLPTTLRMQGALKPRRGRPHEDGVAFRYSSFLNRSLPLADDDKERTLPLLMHHLRREEDIVHLDIDGWRVRRLPPPFSSSTPWFDVELKMTQVNDDEVEVRRVLTVKKNVVQADEVEAYRNAVRKLRLALGRRVHLRQTSTTGGAP